MLFLSALSLFFSLSRHAFTSFSYPSRSLAHDSSLMLPSLLRTTRRREKQRRDYKAKMREFQKLADLVTELFLRALPPSTSQLPSSSPPPPSPHLTALTKNSLPLKASATTMGHLIPPPSPSPLNRPCFPYPREDEHDPIPCLTPQPKPPKLPANPSDMALLLHTLNFAANVSLTSSKAMWARMRGGEELEKSSFVGFLLPRPLLTLALLLLLLLLVFPTE